MANNPKVSIIVPCYNYGHFLPLTLNNVLEQNFADWECIIVNDGSSDSTEDIAKRYMNQDKRFKYFYQPNKGLSAARNTGLEQATGTYIQLLDADDILEENKLLYQSTFLSTHAAFDIVFGDADYFETDEKNIIIKQYPCPTPTWRESYEKGLQTDFFAFLLEKNRLAPCAPLIKKKVFQIIGYFDTTLYSLEDWDFWLRCALKDVKFFYSPAANTKALMRQSSGSMRKNKWKMAYYEYMVRKKIDGILNTKQKRLNKRLAEDRLKTTLYELQTFENREKILSELEKLSSNKRVKYFNNLRKKLPEKRYPFLVWLLFEKPQNIIKSKLKALYAN